MPYCYKFVRTRELRTSQKYCIKLLTFYNENRTASSGKNFKNGNNPSHYRNNPQVITEKYKT